MRRNTTTVVNGIADKVPDDRVSAQWKRQMKKEKRSVQSHVIKEIIVYYTGHFRNQSTK